MCGSQSRSQWRFGVQYQTESTRILGEPSTGGMPMRDLDNEERQGKGAVGRELRKAPAGGGFLRSTWSELSRYLRTIVVALGATVALLLSIAFIQWLMKLLGLAKGLDAVVISSFHSTEIAVLCFFLGTSFLREVRAIRRH